MYTDSIQTDREGFYDITDRVREAVKKSGIRQGMAFVCSLHTTAGITVNETADPTVIGDLLCGLAHISPDRPEYRHLEGNSAAHLKASLVGNSTAIPIEEGRLVLGTWQVMYFCEFDGPRSRTFCVQVIPA